jgi:hypothetical protein
MLTIRSATILVLTCCVAMISCTPATDHGSDTAENANLSWFDLVSGDPFSTHAASTGGVSWIDFDRDGDVDLMVANGYDVSVDEPSPQGNRLYENIDGQLVAVANGAIVEDEGFSSGSTWGDYDNDGWPDVYIANQRDQNNFLYRGQGSGLFERVEDVAPVLGGGNSYAASWVDVDNDGLIDLFVANGGMSHQGPNALYKNQGNGSFKQITEGQMVTEVGASCGVSWADYDGDGDQDVFVCDLSTQATGTGGLYRNDGDWQFTRQGPEVVPTEGLMPQAAAWGDFDNDGDLDLYLAGAYGLANLLLANDGNGRFDRITKGDAVLDGGHSYAASWADADNDGDLDLAVGNWGAAPVLYENDGSGILNRERGGDLGTTVEYPGTMAWADLDGDGALDLAVGNWPNRPGPGEFNKLYRNSRRDGNWLILDLEGTVSNRSGIGARVRATATIRGVKTRQVREVNAHTGFRSQNDLRLHFGFGDSSVVDELEVSWPSGLTTKISAVKVNQVLRITEQHSSE